MLNSDLYSEEAKSFLRTYYQSAYLANTASLALTNEEQPEAIAELREYMDLVSTGEWTCTPPHIRQKKHSRVIDKLLQRSCPTSQQKSAKFSRVFS